MGEGKGEGKEGEEKETIGWGFPRYVDDAGGGFHDQADDEWISTKGLPCPLRSFPCG
jgi:hypothetical protein